ncbi:hypothetical protein VTK73DRAFT_2038 [Phialemonium thermophilum]|uniref:SH3 domain-containing protein n=1 Tax=Phialemonium thermophilum TaxID=223376 RepID=A0ABR3X756_9PEZI
MPFRHNHKQFHERRAGGWDGFVSAAEDTWNHIFAGDDDKTSTTRRVRTITKTLTSGRAEGHDRTTTEKTTEKTTTTSQKASPKTTTSPKTTSSSTRSTSKKSTTTQETQRNLPASFVPTKTQSIPQTLAIATNEPKTPTTVVAQQSETQSPTATPKSGSSNGVSGAAKAGIAIGVLGAVLVVFLAVFFLFSKRRKQLAKQRVADDEKVNGPFADSAAVGPPTPAKAPRLSLRPVTQLFTTLSAPSDSQAGRGGAIAMVSSPTQQTSRSPGASAWERPGTSSSANAANPFGSGAERLQSPTASSSPDQAGFGAMSASSNSPPQVSPVSGAGMAAAAAAGGVAAGMTRKASLRKNGALPKPLDLTKPPGPLPVVPGSPAGTEYSMHSVSSGQVPALSPGAEAIAAAGGPQHSTVHRVQLDFKPTLEDEMELRAGQLVRLLHEYDDGWALCIRLDRSEQGVVPRTCLSTRPVKPRPPQGGGRIGPPVNPNRGPGGYGPGYRPPNGPNRPQGGPPGPMAGPAGRPQSPAERAMSPYGGRPQSPAGNRAMSPHGMRPQSPAPNRAMSPAPRSRSPSPQQLQNRPQSPSGSTRRMSPPGPSSMNQEIRPGPPTGPVGRKPVPGQAY